MHKNLNFDFIIYSTNSTPFVVNTVFFQIFCDDSNFKENNSNVFMKPNARIIAAERMQILIKNAISNSRKFPKLAQRQASLARKISTRYRIKMPYEMKITFCQKCKNFIVPGVNSRIRIGRTSLKAIRITCSFCGHTYRKVMAQ
jgi:ribonuclease P protein subunit RPR2